MRVETKDTFERLPVPGVVDPNIAFDRARQIYVPKHEIYGKRRKRRIRPSNRPPVDQTESIKPAFQSNGSIDFQRR